MQTGWLKLQKDGKDVWYYLKASGVMATGWRKISDKWYYFRPEDGSLVMGQWQKLSDKWYYFGNDGSMQSGWLQLNGSYYYLSASNGNMETGWKTDADGNKYYLEPSNGKMARAWTKIENVWYYFQDNG